MAINLDSYLGVHASALKLREQRTELLARNLANADTPGFKARDLDFSAALAATTSGAGAAGAPGWNPPSTGAGVAGAPTGCNPPGSAGAAFGGVAGTCIVGEF